MLSLLTRCISGPQGNRDDIFETPRLNPSAQGALSSEQEPARNKQALEEETLHSNNDLNTILHGLKVRTKQSKPRHAEAAACSCRPPQLLPSISWPVHNQAQDHAISVLTACTSMDHSGSRHETMPAAPTTHHTSSAGPKPSQCSKAAAVTAGSNAISAELGTDSTATYNTSHAHQRTAHVLHAVDLEASRRTHSSTSNTASMFTANDLSMHPCTVLATLLSADPSAYTAAAAAVAAAPGCSTGPPSGSAHEDPPRDAVVLQHSYMQRSRAAAADAEPALALNASIRSPQRGGNRQDNSATPHALGSEGQDRCRRRGTSAPGQRQHAASAGAAELRQRPTARAAEPGSYPAASVDLRVTAASPPMSREELKTQMIREWLSCTADFMVDFTPEPDDFTMGFTPQAGSGAELPPPPPPESEPEEGMPSAPCRSAQEEDSQWGLLDPQAWKLNWGLPPPDSDTCPSPFTCLSGYQSCSESPHARPGGCGGFSQERLLEKLQQKLR